MEKNVITFILGGIIVVLAVVLIYVGVSNGIFIGTGIKDVIPKDEIGEFTLDFIRQELAAPGTEFTLIDVEEEYGMYKVNFEVMGQTDSAYVTKNGKYLFFQPFDMLPPEPVEPKSFSKSDKPEVDLFVMSYCPYGNQAEELMMPVVDLLGDNADIELRYIVYSDYQTGYPDYCIDEANKYCSMHKIGELNQGIRELCVQKYDPLNFWNFVKQANAQATYDDIDAKWQGIASSLGIDVNMVNDCQQNEGIALLDNELILTGTLYPVQDPANHGSKEEDMISGSPTLVINGMIYDGARSANDYKEAICSAMNNPIDGCEQDLITNDAPAGGSCE
ncbi:hypothetical protein KJ591_02040 [Patescibacteria group bacterium]|nr:hypothetical protein [Patescibacteria group bacterium]MBU4078463.1 hypothetical protein [Patescibacteria group bacterium]